MNAPVKLVAHQRAYSILNVKKVDEDQRRIEGMATTPTTDRMGDIVDSKGVEFDNPMPFLWQHNHDQPVGQVRFGKATADGIPFEAQLADPAKATSTTLKERLLEAWDSVKMGLVRGVSIGFIPLEWNFMKEGGIRFEKVEVYELSLVTIPANAEATISQIKSADVRAALGKPNSARTIEIRAPASGGRVEVKSAKVRATPAASFPKVTAAKERTMPRTIDEQVKDYRAKQKENATRMQAIMAASEESGETLGADEQKEFDDLDTENSTIDGHLKRLERMQEINLKSLQPVEPAQEVSRVARGAEELRTGVARVTSVKPNVPAGTGFIRLAMAMAAGKGDLYRSIKYAKESVKNGGWSNTPEVLTILDECDDLPGMMQKAAVGAGTTTDATWASPLIAYTQLASEFVGLLRPATIIGKIPNLRQVPFNIQIPVATAGTTVGWVGENAPKPVGNMQFTSITMRWAKAAGIIVITQELARFSNPAAEAVVRQDLIDQMVQFLDRQFVDPAVAAVTNVSPASITNGVTPVTASGTNQAAFVADAKSLFSQFLAANLSAAGGVWIGTQQQALAFSLMLNALGQPFYPTMTGEGGTLLGYPYIASENLPATGGSPADGYPLIFAKASEIMLADDGQTVLDASNQASVNMDSTPDSPPTGTTTLVSLWQMNLTGIRAERWINWQKRRSTAVQFIQNAKYA